MSGRLLKITENFLSKCFECAGKFGAIKLIRMGMFLNMSSKCSLYNVSFLPRVVLFAPWADRSDLIRLLLFLLVAKRSLPEEEKAEVSLLSVLVSLS